MPYSEIYNRYSQLSDPAYQQEELGRRIELAQPELQKLLRSLEARLNQQGLFSSAPVIRET